MQGTAAVADRAPTHPASTRSITAHALDCMGDRQVSVVIRAARHIDPREIFRSRLGRQRAPPDQHRRRNLGLIDRRTRRRAGSPPGSP
jgi:hypothetical protein